MMTGSLATALWLVFVKDAEAQALGICHALFGVRSLAVNAPNWPVVDPLEVGGSTQYYFGIGRTF